MASHSYSFSLKLHVIRTIITTPYSSPKTLFSFAHAVLWGMGRGGSEHARAVSQKRSSLEMAGGWSPPFVAPLRLCSKATIRGPE